MPDKRVPSFIAVLRTINTDTPDVPSNVLSKYDVAYRQLIAAIHLYFDGGDRLAVYSLAANAHAIATDLMTHLQAKSMIDIMSAASGISRKELLRHLRTVPNFLKHADRDPVATIEEPDDFFVTLMLRAACEDLRAIGSGVPLECFLFVFWFMARRRSRRVAPSDIATDGYMQMAGQLFPELEGKPEAEQIAAWHDQLQRHLAKRRDRHHRRQGDEMRFPDWRLPFEKKGEAQ